MYTYFYPANIPPYGADNVNVKKFGTEYYEQVLSTALSGNATATEMPDSLEKLEFPVLSRCVTPSVAIYRKQQEQWLRYRQRFIQTVVGSYADNSQPLNYAAETLVIDQRAGLANLPKESVGSGNDPTQGPDSKPPQTIIADATAIPGKGLLGRKVRARFAYGLPV